YQALAERLNGNEGISALEINISCPNVKKGGVAFGTDPKMAQKVTEAVRAVTDLPLIVKLSPNVTDITVIAKAVEAGGADAVSLINTLLGMAIDTKTRRPKLANIVGGLSGPAVKPVALRMVWQVAQAVKIPVVGIGGITTTEDAIEFLIAGATAIEIGTANFINPRVTEEIITGIKDYLVGNKMASIEDLIGSLIFLSCNKYHKIGELQWKTFLMRSLKISSTQSTKAILGGANPWPWPVARDAVAAARKV
ncbi:MAG: dihydroorotate dehydrogenase, partial [Desulfobulbaceae bacterium]|nr:dihydroorotate dehydrogenase [Desulfobulbaceae bacterium]